MNEGLHVDGIPVYYVGHTNCEYSSERLFGNCKECGKHLDTAFTQNRSDEWIKEKFNMEVCRCVCKKCNVPLIIEGVSKNRPNYPLDLDYWFTLEGEGIDKENIKVLLNNGYTKDGIVELFRQLLEELK